MSKFGWSLPPGAAMAPGAPYNNDDPAIVDEAVAGKDLTCPHCGDVAKWYVDIDKAIFPSDLTHDEVSREGWFCWSCEWEQESVEDDWKRAETMKKDLGPRIDAVNRKLWKPRAKEPAPNLDSIFDCAPEGDFEWKDSEAGDWHIWCCGESDCPRQWHRTASSVDMGRTDGKRWIETNTVDEDGNWDCDSRWEDGEDWEASDVAWHLSHDSNGFFRGWTEYWLSCASSGKDPAEEYIGKPLSGVAWVEYCVKAAEENAKYL